MCLGQDWPWVDGGYHTLGSSFVCRCPQNKKSIFKEQSVPIFMMKLMDLNCKFANRKTGSL